MRKPNVRFMAWFFGSLAAIIALTHFWHQVQVRRNAKINLSRANELSEAGRDGEALWYLQRYLMLAPADDDALQKLGELQRRSGQIQPAYMTLERLVRRAPERLEVRRDLVRLAMALRRPADAQAHLEPLLREFPDDAELFELRAGAFELTGTNSADARAAYQAALTLEPKRVDCYARLAELLRTSIKDETEADRVIMQMVAKNPGSSLAFRRRGEYFQRYSRRAEAAADANKALELAPDDPDCVALAARCAADAQDDVRAHELANRAIELAPDQAASYILLAEIEGRLGSRDKQRAALERGRAALPNDILLAWNLAHVVVDERDAPGAEKLIAELRRFNYAPALVSYLDARVKLAHEQWGAGIDQLETIRPALSDWPDLAFEADQWLAAGSARLGNPDLQLLALRSAVRLKPSSSAAHAQLAELYLQLGRLDEALQTYRNAATSPDAAASVSVRIVQLQILRNLSLRPEKRDWRPIEATLDAAASQTPDEPVVTMLRAEVLAAKGQTKDAVSLLSQSVKKSPDVLDYWLALIRLAERERNHDRASALLKAARERKPDSPELLLLEAELAALAQGADAINALKRAESELQSADVSQRTALLHSLAGLYEGIGEADEARRLIESLVKVEPHNLALSLALFDLAKRRNDEDAMQAAIDQIERIEGAGRGVLFRYAAAVRSMLGFKQHGRSALVEARQWLREAVARRPGWARLARLGAEIAELEHDFSTAIDQYQQAIRLGDRSQLVLRRLVQLLYERRKFAEADQALRRLEEQQVPFSKELSQVASHVSLELNEFGRAVDLARPTSTSTDYRDQIWLGAVLTAANQTEEAEQAYRRAVELGPAAGGPWVALVQFLVARGRTDSAEEALVQARERIAGDERPLALANCYETLNRPQQAEQAYLEALSSAADNLSVQRIVADFYVRQQKIEKAEELLRQMIAHTDASSADLNWARRNLGLMWGVGRGYQEFERGLALINKNLQVAEPRLEDQRAKAVLLAAQPALKFKQQGIKLLEELAKRDAASPGDLFVLAKLYEGAGRWTDAQRLLQSLVAASPTVEHIAYFVRTTLAHGATRDVDLWLTKLRQLEPDGAQTVELSARGDVAKGDFDSALARLRQFAESSGGGDDALRSRLAAQLCAELASQTQRPTFAASRNDEETRRQEAELKRWSAGRQQLVQAAESHFARYLQQQPDDTLDYCGFLAAQGRTAEAVKLFVAAAKANAAPRMVGAAQSIVNSGRASQAEIAAVKATLSAMPGLDNSAPLLTALGDLESFLGQFDAAEQYYRSAIKADRNFVLALNNLAVTLALRNRSVNEAGLFIARAIEIAGPVAELLDSRATVELARGNAEGAIKDLQEALVTSPTAGVYFHLAQAQLARGDAAGAKTSYDKAVGLKLSRDALTALERPAWEKLTAALRL